MEGSGKAELLQKGNFPSDLKLAVPSDAERAGSLKYFFFSLLGGVNVET